MTETERIKAAVAEKMKMIRKEHFSKDLPIVYAKEGWIVKEYKDGTIEKVKKL